MSIPKQTKLSSIFSVSPLHTQSGNVLDRSMPLKRQGGPESKQASHKRPRNGENIPNKKFLMTKAVKTLSLQNKTHGLVHTFGKTWLPALEKEFTKPYFEQLSKFVEQERKKHTIYPKPEDIFAWTTACDLKDVKVVILGQDPYHGPNQAHGLCFSVLPGVKIPPSLQNMYKELASDITGLPSPDHGYLGGWASQGVLLLNAVLTVRSGSANSHKDKGWEKLTDAVIQYLNTNMSNIVFMLWGSYAQKKGAHIKQKKHCVLRGVHPSPLSAHRGFFGCKHFSQANAYLESHKRTAVDWSHLPNL